MDNIIGILLKDTLKAFDGKIDLKIGANSKYHQEDIFKLILTASVNTTYIESSTFQLKIFEIENHLEKVVKLSYLMAEKRRLFGKYAAVAHIPYPKYISKSIFTNSDN